MNKYLIFFALISVSFILACGDDDTVDPCDSLSATYNGDVKAIIDGACAYSGCHSGGTDANANIPMGSNDFTTYAALQPGLDAGGFNARALQARNMPPADFVPAGFPTELTEEQLELLICWRDAGYPEN